MRGRPATHQMPDQTQSPSHRLYDPKPSIPQPLMFCYILVDGEFIEEVVGREDYLGRDSGGWVRARRSSGRERENVSE